MSNTCNQFNLFDRKIIGFKDIFEFVNFQINLTPIGNLTFRIPKDINFKVHILSFNLEFKISLLATNSLRFEYIASLTHEGITNGHKKVIDLFIDTFCGFDIGLNTLSFLFFFASHLVNRFFTFYCDFANSDRTFGRFNLRLLVLFNMDCLR